MVPERLKQRLDDMRNSGILIKLYNFHGNIIYYCSTWAGYLFLPLMVCLLASSERKNWYGYGIFHNIIWLVCVLMFIGMLYQLQDKLLYHPEVPENSRFYVPIPQTIPYDVVNITTRDGIILHGFLLLQSKEIKSVPTIIYFHGNAGNAGSPCCSLLYFLCKVNVLSVDYRGYGKSLGSPTEQGLNEDAHACVAYLHSRKDIDTNKVVLFGHSLGGAIAIHTASELQHNSQYKISAIILENTFTNLSEMSVKIFSTLIPFIKYLPVWALKNKFESKSKISSIVIPTLFISGEKDEIVCPSMTNALYNSANNTKSCILKVKGGSHNDTWCSSPQYWMYISKFLAKVFNENFEEDWKWEATINI